MVQQQRDVSQFHTEDHVSPIDQILDATCRIVARYGFHGATVERVATQAQLPTAAITHSFPTRAAIIREGVRVGLLRPHNTEASAFFLHEAMWSCLLRRFLTLEPYTPCVATIDAELLLDLFFQGLVNTESKTHPRKDKRQ